MKGKIFSSFILLFFVSTMSFAYTYVRMLGMPGDSCTPGPSSPESYEAAEGCVTVGDSRCYGSMQVTDMSCPDPTEPSLNFIFNNVGTTIVEQSIDNVQMGTESVVARGAFNTFVTGTFIPTCPSPYLAGASGDGYIFSTSAAVDGIGSNIHLTMWRRVDCSLSGSSGSLTPIGGIGSGGSGGGGTATDMVPTNTLITQSNTLLTDINTKLSAPSGGGSATDMTETNNLLSQIRTNTAGGGGTATDMTATNDLLTGIQSSLSPGSDTGDILAPDTSIIGTDLDASLSAPGVNPSGPGGLNEQLDASLEFHGKAGKSSFQEIFETHRTAWMASSSSNSLFTWINSLNANFTSGLPSFNFNLSWVKVNRNIDLNDYSILFDMFRICVLFTATIVSYRIVFKG